MLIWRDLSEMDKRLGVWTYWDGWRIRNSIFRSFGDDGHFAFHLVALLLWRDSMHIQMLENVEE
jgi:hypothetical protein